MPSLGTATVREVKDEEKKDGLLNTNAGSYDTRDLNVKEQSFQESGKHKMSQFPR